ncbi:ABC-type transport system periplasmic substrate-binding protein (probable substrate dipeptide/oligopeptide) (plasmid) [Haloferax volcanii DS2]|nr:ABC transporter substrate-binding protein [Haloferax volcanii]ADE05264.1 ABC-type transport system periplasmic substrate-binding protein (probable substrate dipeptide/oligopeptide) [Haloferax volcanii DS2]MDW7539309.1 ABC transporter substrate-binding protein [Haloferax volcanii]
MDSDTALDRRRYLGLLGGSAVTGIAGCTGGSNQEGTLGTSSDSDSDQDTDSSSESSSGNLRGGHLRIAITPETTTINPVMMQSKFPQRWGVKLFYSTLTRVDSNLEPYGDLAEDWSSNDASDEWTFTLREATFHDGSPVTAADVKATFDTVYDEEVGSPGMGTMGDIQQVEAVDKRTVKFTLGTQNSDFHKLVSKGWGSIVPEDIVTDAKKRQALGTEEHGSGAFTLESFAPGDQLVGVAYDDYYRTGDDGESLPYIDRISQITIPEKSNQVNALRSGDIDIIWQPGYGQWGLLQSLDSVTAHRTPGGEIANFVMNVSVEPWSDPRVRQAVKHAIDREAILNAVQDGLGTIGQDSLLSPAYEYYSDIGAPERDLEKAKELLAEAGYPDGINLTEEFDLTLQTASNIPHMRGTAVLMQEQLKEAGIEFELETMSYGNWSATVWKKSPFYVGAYGMRISGANFMKLMLHSEGNWNGESDWSNEEFDEVIDKAIAETDVDQKQQYMQTAQKLVRDEGPYAISFYIDTIGASKNYVEKYNLNPLAYQIYPDEYALGSDAPTK